MLSIPFRAVAFRLAATGGWTTMKTHGSVGVRYLALDNRCETHFMIRFGQNPNDRVTVDHETMHWFPPERARAIWNSILESRYWKVAD
jgi:hypothetical protein